MSYTPGLHKKILPPTPYALRRFMKAVDSTKECWRWTGFINKDGYGQITIDKETYKAHRVSYTWMKGTIPETLTLDHVCHNRWCVNPQHLDPVLASVNVSRQRFFKTGCRNGHAYTEENTYYYSGANRFRMCRICMAANQKRFTERKKLKEGII